MKKFWIGAALAAALSLVGCGGGGNKSESSKATESAAVLDGTAVPDEVNGGTITGKVVFDGAKPAVKTLDMSAAPVCVRAHPDGAPAEDVIVNSNGTLKNAFVWVKAGLPADMKWKIPSTTVDLDQKGCLYQPRVIGAMTGQKIDFKTSDPTNHNVHPTPQANEEWNESQPPGDPGRIKTFTRQEVMIPVKCQIHPWMKAYIGVLSHPFFAVTGDDGTFTIKGLPPGTYTLQVWTEKYGTQEQQVTVGGKESKTADFAVKG